MKRPLTALLPILTPLAIGLSPSAASDRAARPGSAMRAPRPIRACRHFLGTTRRHDSKHLSWSRVLAGTYPQPNDHSPSQLRRAIFRLDGIGRRTSSLKGVKMIDISALRVAQPHEVEPGTLLLGGAHYSDPPTFVFA